jgi:hypothetical protein
VLEVEFILLESLSPWRRIFIGSHSLPPLWFAVSVLKLLTYDWAIVCTDHPEFMHNLRRRSKLIQFEHTHHSEFIRVVMKAKEEQWRYGGNR